MFYSITKYEKIEVYILTLKIYKTITIHIFEKQNRTAILIFRITYCHSQKLEKEAGVQSDKIINFL